MNEIEFDEILNKITRKVQDTLVEESSPELKNMFTAMSLYLQSDPEIVSTSVFEIFQEFQRSRQLDYNKALTFGIFIGLSFLSFEVKKKSKKNEKISKVNNLKELLQ